MFDLKNLFKTGILSLVLLFFVSPPAMGADIIGFESAITLSLQNDDNLRAQRQTINTMEQRVQDSIRNYFPDLSVDMTIREPNEAGRTGSAQSSVDLTQPLWTGGRLTGVHAQNQHGLTSARHEYRIMAEERILETAEVYLELLRQQLNIERQENLKVNAVKAFELIEKQYEMGQSTWADVLEARQQLNEVKGKLANFYNSRNEARYGLNNLIGNEIETSLSVRRDRFVIQDTAPAQIKSEKVEADVQTMLEESSELQRLQSEIEYYEQGLELARAHYLPEINFNGNYSVAGENLMATEQKEEYYLGVNMKMFVFGHSLNSNYEEHENALASTGYTKYGGTLRFFDNSSDIITTPIDSRQSVENVGSLDIQTQQAETRLDEAVISYEEQKRSLEAQLRTNYNTLGRHILSIEHKLDTLEYQNENVQLMLKMHESGRATVLEVLEALINRENTRVELIEAWYNYYLTEFKIDLATGRISPKL